jgi:hypothetical protein
MALGAGQGDINTRLSQELACALICDSLLGMGIVTVAANGSIGITSRDRVLEDTIQCLLILVRMAVLAGGIELKREIARTCRCHFRMREPGNIRMAVYTGDIFGSMYRSFEGCGIDRDR